MFWFNHPKPFNQKPVAVQVVQRKTKAPQATNLIIVETKAPAEHTPMAADAATPKK